MWWNLALETRANRLILWCDLLVLISGVFHAPVSGLYLLSVYARTANNAGYLYIKKNDDVVCATQVTGGNSASDDHGLDTGTCTGIVELVPEDTVRDTGTSDALARIAGGYSGFTGHLIQPYCWRYCERMDFWTRRILIQRIDNMKRNCIVVIILMKYTYNLVSVLKCLTVYINKCD